MNFENTQDFYETLTELRKDAQMLRLMLFGFEVDVDELRLQCLFRMSDYLDQHIKDVCNMSGYWNSESCLH